MTTLVITQQAYKVLLRVYGVLCRARMHCGVSTRCSRCSHFRADVAKVRRKNTNVLNSSKQVIRVKIYCRKLKFCLMTLYLITTIIIFPFHFGLVSSCALCSGISLLPVFLNTVFTTENVFLSIATIEKIGYR